MPICCGQSGSSEVPSGTTLPSGEGSACMISMLRVYINDMDGTSYTDSRLNQVLGVAQFFVTADLECCTQVQRPDFCYCVDTPDLQVCLYPEFSVLVALYAACLIDRGTARTKAEASSLTAACGPAKFSISTSAAALQSLLEKGNCQAYEDLKESVCCSYGNITEYCGQIVSVFTSPNYYTSGWCPTSCRSTSC